MYLLINTSSNEKMYLGVANRQGRLVVKQEVPGKFQQSSKLLPSIERILKRAGLKLTGLKGVAVISGPGSFTALRVGIATANGLAYALNIPIIGVKDVQNKGLNSLAIKAAKVLSKKKFSTIAIPAYGSQPNITIRNVSK